MNNEDDEQLNGTVEVDETAWGGKPRRKMNRQKRARLRGTTKDTVLGMVERGGPRPGPRDRVAARGAA